MDIKITIPDLEKNKQSEKKLDNLERKFDQKYKAFVEKKDNTKIIEKMHSSFMNNFNKMMSLQKTALSQDRKKMDVLKEGILSKIKAIEPKESGDSKLLVKKLDSLESAIKNISLKPQIVRVGNGSKVDISKSFEKMFLRLEEAIKKARPRLTPSPS